MYDNIKAKKPVSLISVTELEHIKTVFCCSTTTKNCGFNNSDTFKHSSLGVYISFDSSFLHISFSLHKFYNFVTGAGRSNYSVFSREDVGVAVSLFVSHFEIDLFGFLVVSYECGFNFVCAMPPSTYFKELDYILYGNRRIRIIENPHYKEYLSYSTHSDKDKRAVYVFYNKYEECGRVCKKNSVRVEKKYRRVSIPLPDLFKKSFLDSCYSDICDIFLHKLFYKEYASLSKSKHYVHSFAVLGIDSAIELLNVMRQNNELTTLQYFRLKKSVIDFDFSSVSYYERPASIEFRAGLALALSVL
jgi:hypothetical protein